MLYAALHIEEFIGKKKKLVGPGSLVDSDEWALWYSRSTDSNREKADVAVTNLEDADFWSMPFSPPAAPSRCRRGVATPRRFDFEVSRMQSICGATRFGG